MKIQTVNCIQHDRAVCVVGLCCAVLMMPWQGYD